MGRFLRVLSISSRGTGFKNMLSPDAEWLTGLAISVVGAIISIVVSRHYGARRSGILVSAYQNRVFDGMAPQGFAVRWDDIDIAQPGIVVISVRNFGPMDVGPDHFNGGRLAILLANAERICGALDTSSLPVRLVPAGSEVWIEVQPTMIPAGSSKDVRFLSSGTVEVSQREDAVDCRILNASLERRGLEARRLALLALVQVPSCLGLIFAASRPSAISYSAVAILLVAGAIVTWTLRIHQGPYGISGGFAGDSRIKPGQRLTPLE